MPTRIRCIMAMTILCYCVALLPAVAQEKGDPFKTDLDLLQGTWNLVPIERPARGKKPDALQTITFQKDKFEFKRGVAIFRAGSHTLDPTKDPKTIDLKVAEGEGKGTVLPGVYEINGDTLKICFDPQGKTRPTSLTPSVQSGYSLLVTQKERAGVDPRDPSIVYDRPFQMNSGFKAYNGKAYDKAALFVEPGTKVVLPDKETIVWKHDQAELLIFMEKRATIRAHLSHDVSIADYRQKMGCAVKLEKGELLIGTYGEFGFLEGATGMRLLVYVPPKVEVERRPGLIGGYGGRAGAERPPGAINPTQNDPKPALTKMKEGKPSVWLPPTEEDGWHEIPAVPDVQRRVGGGAG